MGEGALGGLHVLEGQAEALAVGLDEVARDEMPSFAFLVLPCEMGLLAGLFVERLEEALGRRGHVGGGVVSVGLAEQRQQEGGDRKEFHV